MTDIEARFRKIITEVVKRDLDANEIVGDDLTVELGITSIDALEILIWVEEEFDITLPDEDLSIELVSSIRNMVDYISSRRTSKSQ